MALENKNSPIANLYLAFRADILLFLNSDSDEITAEKIANQSHRRHIVRAIVAFIAAMTFQLRRTTF